MPTDDLPPNNPERFLDLIRRQQRGKLKIYLGFAAGVGKTFEMLPGRKSPAEARRRRRDRLRGNARPRRDHRADRRARAGAPAARSSIAESCSKKWTSTPCWNAGRPSPWSTNWPTPTPPAAAIRNATSTWKNCCAPASASSPRSTSSTWKACTTSSNGRPAFASRSACPTTSSRWPTRSSTSTFRRKTSASGCRPARSIPASGSRRRWTTSSPRRS